MRDSEKKLLIALVLMVNKYLDEYGDLVDSRSMSAGEYAIEALASVGLMKVVNTRFGRWTPAGKRFRREEAGIYDPESIGYAGADKVGREARAGKLIPTMRSPTSAASPKS